jgi:hypothetical protein
MNPETEDMYRVRCNCGREALVNHDDLTHGRVTSCGCDGADYFYCHCESGLIVSSTPIVTCKAQCQRN